MSNASSIRGSTALPPKSVLAHVVDVHCHPTDSPIITEVMESLPIRICAMATRGSDQKLVRNLAEAYPAKVIPCFGYHPWFTHWISTKAVSTKEEHYQSLFLQESSKHEDLQAALSRLIAYLPEPTPLSIILGELRQDLLRFPNAMLGEVGLDRACRVPYASPSPPPYVLHDSRRDLSPFTIPISHQLEILEAQMDLAVELRRNVSLHSVKSQQATVELLDKMKSKHADVWKQIHVDLHSCGLSDPTWRDIQRKHNNVFLSLSSVINSRSPAYKALIYATPADRILVESDYNDPAQLAKQTWQMVLTIAEVKGWSVEKDWTDEVPSEERGVVERLEENWVAFSTVN